MRFLQSSAARAPARGLLIALPVVASLACTLGTLGPPPARPGPLPRASLLAVGDTGEPPGLFGLRHPARRVGEAMAAEDRYRRARALVLLGDNFYPRGLRSDRLLAQIRESIAAPFCHFLDPRSPRAAELAPACKLGPGHAPPLPILAVLGNHDYGSSGSPERERAAIPAWIPNWELAPGVASTRELEGGLSLIRVDSTALLRGADPGAVVEKLESAHGPWRILVLHHPVVVPGDLVPGDLAAGDAAAEGPRSSPGDPADRGRRYREAARRWLAEAAVPVQLVVSGHEHNLELVPLPPPLRGLQVIAGSGSRLEAAPAADRARRFFARATPGFARIDLVGSGAGEHLEVLLFQAPDRRWPGAHRARILARWAVSRDGRVTRLGPPP